MTVYQSSFDPAFRALILQAFSAFASVPAACAGMTHGDQLISWLQAQWATAEATRHDMEIRALKPRTSAEKEAYLGILDKLVTNLVAREVDRPITPTGADHAESDTMSPSSPPFWIAQTEGVVARALNECADLARFELLARIVLRLAKLPVSADTVAYLLARLLTKLKELRMAAEQAFIVEGGWTPADIHEERDLIEERVYPPQETAVELLFRIGLEIPVEHIKGEARLAIVEIGKTVRERYAHSELGRWVEREKMLADWERARA